MGWIVSFASFIDVGVCSEALPAWLGLAGQLADQISDPNHFERNIFVSVVR
jgi:hypothetical protein